MRTLASSMPLGGPDRSGAAKRPASRWTAWLAAIALHAALLTLFLAVIRSGDRTVPHAPVTLAPAPVDVAARPATPPEGARPAVRALRALPPRAPVPEGVAPAPRPVPVLPAPGVRPPAGASDVVRAYRRGTAPADTAALSGEALRRTALAEATRRWNVAFHGILPEVRRDMFLEKLQDSPFPRR